MNTDKKHDKHKHKDKTHKKNPTWMKQRLKTHNRIFNANHMEVIPDDLRDIISLSIVR